MFSAVTRITAPKQALDRMAEAYRSSPMFGAHHSPGTGGDGSATMAQFGAEVV